MVDVNKLKAYLDKERPLRVNIKKSQLAKKGDDAVPDIETEDVDIEEAELDEQEEEITEELVEEVAERVEAGEADPELEALMEEFDPENNPPEWVASEATWEKAKKAVKPEGAGARKYSDPYAVVAHVYKKMGGRVA